VAVGSILGLGSRGYDLALDFVIGRLKPKGSAGA
jgi:3-dehydroquinate dehydratase